MSFLAKRGNTYNFLLTTYDYNMQIAELNKTATQIRRDIVRMVHQCKSGHPGGSLGCADFFTALYFEIMHIDTDFKMDGKNEDLLLIGSGL